MASSCYDGEFRMRFTKEEFHKYVSKLKGRYEELFDCSWGERNRCSQYVSDLYELIIEMSDLNRNRLDLFNRFIFDLDFGRDSGVSESVPLFPYKLTVPLGTIDNLFDALVLMETLQSKAVDLNKIKKE